MTNYGRDGIWDAATWAEIDQAVADQVKRLSIARRVFETVDLSAASGGAPSWISTAQIAGAPLNIPQGAADPFVEISIPFELTPAQVAAEATHHTARGLACAAVRTLVQQEEQLIFGANPAPAPSAGGRPGGLAAGPPPLAVENIPAAAGVIAAQDLLNSVMAAVATLARRGWPDPYALILDPGLFQVAVTEQLDPGRPETPADRFARRIHDYAVSGALPPNQGVLVSLAGDPLTIYLAHDVAAAFTGQPIGAVNPVYGFRVFERFQYVITDLTGAVALQA